MGKALFFNFWFSMPQIAWDGIKAPAYFQEDSSINPDYRICVDEDENTKVAILDAAKNFENLTTDPKKLNCEI